MTGRRSSRSDVGRCACLAARTLAVVWTLTATTMVDIAESGLDKTCTSQQLMARSMRGICGSRLSGTLCILCRRYNKRSVDSTLRKSALIAALVLHRNEALDDVNAIQTIDAVHRMTPMMDSSPTDDGRAVARASTHAGASPDAAAASTTTVWPFLSTEEALSFARHRPRRSTSSGAGAGIVCECCVNRCTLNELLEYCDTSSTGPPNFGSRRGQERQRKTC